jgi:hypothetical protein
LLVEPTVKIAAEVFLSTGQEWPHGERSSGDARALHMGEFVKRRCKPMKKTHVDVIDQWNDGTIVATFTSPAEAYEAIRKLGQDTRDGRWRYILAPAPRPVLDPDDAASISPIQH